MTPEDMRRLFAYHAWAFDQVWACIEELTDDQFVEDIDYSRGSIRSQTLHIVTAIERWMQRLEGRAPDPDPDGKEFPTAASVRARWEQTRVRLNAYLEGLDQEELDAPVAGRLAGRGLDFAAKRSDLLLHLANHGTDHRAQVLAMLHSQFHVPTVEQDLVLYLIKAAGVSH